MEKKKQPNSGIKATKFRYKGSREDDGLQKNHHFQQSECV